MSDSRTFPEILYPSQFDRYCFDFERQFGLDGEGMRQDAVDFAEKTGGEIYTQVDSARGIIYERGLHYVNSTGIYHVVKKNGYNPIRGGE